MSYILDALRRSEQERRRLEPAATVAAPEPAAAGGRSWLPWLLGAALAANAAGLGWLLLQEPATAPPPLPTPAVDAAVAAGPPRLGPRLADIAGRPNMPSPAVASRPAATSGEARTEPEPAPLPAEPEPPLLEALPAEFRRSVPAIGVSVHVYAAQPAARWVLIDGKRYREAQELPGGVRLERIMPDGMVLSFRGTRFLVTLR